MPLRRLPILLSAFLAAMAAVAGAAPVAVPCEVGCCDEVPVASSCDCCLVACCETESAPPALVAGRLAVDQPAVAVGAVVATDACARIATPGHPPTDPPPTVPRSVATTVLLI